MWGTATSRLIATAVAINSFANRMIETSFDVVFIDD